MPNYGWKKTEHYPIDGGESAELAQRLFDSGLLYWVNAAVLHNFGLALGVSGEHIDDEFVVDGLALNLTEDPNGVWYDEATTEVAREKMRRAGIARNVSLPSNLDD